MNVEEKVRLAVVNNAKWCDLVCRSHDKKGVSSSDVWFLEQPAPMYYPNLISKVPGVDIRPCLTLLKTKNLPMYWGIKDSYAEWDLSEQGFQPFIEADWFWREPVVVVDTSEKGWDIVRSQSQFECWQENWSDLQSHQRPLKFSLLNNASVCFLLQSRDDGSYAGFVAFRSEQVIGLSNLFGELSKEDLLPGLAVLARHFGDLPLVGYESEERYALMQECDFEPIGALRIWLKTE